MAKPCPRAGLTNAAPYVPGKTTVAREGVHKLSMNESALGASPKAMEAFIAAATEASRYPETTARELRAAIGEIHNLDPERIIVGAGSDEIIQLLIRTYCEDGDEVLLTEHAFSYYAVATRAGGAVPVFAPEQALTADIDALLSAQTEKTKIVFLANPNNPTGTMVGREAVARLRDGLRDDIILVLDGAYAEYMETDSYSDGRDFVDASIEAEQDNVVMMRTFSKIYGLGGLRIGWAYASPYIIDMLNSVRGPFNVARPALAAAEAAVRDQAFVKKNRDHNREQRARLAGALTQLGYRVTPSFGNFVLFAPGDTSSNTPSMILKHLEDNGVLIRPTSSSNLPGHLRVTVGSIEANTAFLDVMTSLGA